MIGVKGKDSHKKNKMGAEVSESEQLSLIINDASIFANISQISRILIRDPEAKVK